MQDIRDDPELNQDLLRLGEQRQAQLTSIIHKCQEQAFEEFKNISFRGTGHSGEMRPTSTSSLLDTRPHGPPPPPAPFIVQPTIQDMPALSDIGVQSASSVESLLRRTSAESYRPSSRSSISHPSSTGKAPAQASQLHDSPQQFQKTFNSSFMQQSFTGDSRTLEILRGDVTHPSERYDWSTTTNNLQGHRSLPEIRIDDGTSVYATGAPMLHGQYNFPASTATTFPPALSILQSNDASVMLPVTNHNGFGTNSTGFQPMWSEDSPLSSVYYPPGWAPDQPMYQRNGGFGGQDGS